MSEVSEQVEMEREARVPASYGDAMAEYAAVREGGAGLITSERVGVSM